ncbi:MAG: hypothetical protein K6E50_14470 [Lachnospiraceae bacterium]|nr:hypothetical protein [Lachnospiraceae bacterium]
MKLLIHDLNENEWKEISAEYRDWETVRDNGSIKPCVGCFGCWVKNPGECVIKDGYERVAALMHRAEEITVISRYAYGGFSSFIKNVFDRSIGLVLPFFEIHEGEMHHKRRYEEDLPIRFIFRGTGLTDEDKERARQYVNAVCRNFRGNILSIEFEECSEPGRQDAGALPAGGDQSEKTILLNCSMRGNKANSKKFLDILSGQISGEKENINLSSYVGRESELIGILGSASKLVFGMPLYVDGIPSQLLRIMEKMEGQQRKGNKTIYAVANMGFYESAQIKNLLGMVGAWCEKCGYVYGGGLAIGAGEMMGNGKLAEMPKGPAGNMIKGLEKLGNAVSESRVAGDIYADASGFSRGMYMACANFSWMPQARKNGLKKRDLFRRK